ncbi:MAG: glycoside hydrolase family 28 protein [Bryobacteraceae bacterium]
MLNPFRRRQFLLGLGGASALPAAATASSLNAASVIHDVRQYGADAGGARLSTSAIQAAVDACARAGGGTVLLPAGTYVSGTIVLKSHVSLQLDPGAVLRASRDLRDYPLHVPALRSYTDTYTDKSLIYAEDAENIGITGRGTIDGQGTSFKGEYKVRPYVIRFVKCHDVSVSGVTIRDSPMWVQHYLACDQVNIRGITVRSRVNSNNDGIDIDACRGVRISDCDIWSGDDAIVLKATLDRPCRDVVVTNCVLSTLCNALKLGTESNGGFENITFSNCAIYDTRLAGIAIEMVDGGVLDRVNVSNIVMTNVVAPIFVRLGDRARPFTAGGPRPPVGKLRNLSITDVQADGAGQTACAIAGLAGHEIENVVLDNIRLSFGGGGSASDPNREIPEKPDGYPEFSMFGKLPAYGLYCRHVKNLRLSNIQTGFTEPEGRPAMVADDVETLEMANCRWTQGPDADSAVRFTQTRHAFVHGCRSSGPVGTWARVTGERSRHVRFLGNDLDSAGRVVETSPEVAGDAVAVSA